MKLGPLLRSRRDALDLTLQEVGDSGRISTSHLHDIEFGRHANIGIVTPSRLALALGINIAMLASAALETDPTARRDRS